MGGSHAKLAALPPTTATVTMEDIGAHILNADPELKDVPWSQKQLYARRALEHAKTQHLQGGTNRVIEPFWDKLALSQQPALTTIRPDPAMPRSTTLRSERFRESINTPKVHQPTKSQLGLSSPASYLSGGSADSSSDNDDDDDEDDD
jgi:hypothetical protein